MIDTFLFFCLCSWSLAGLFGVDAVQSVSVTEGDSVSLNVTDVQTNDEIEWRFGGILIAEINIKNKKSTFYNDSADGRFRDRLKLDQTGSLIITNTRTNHSGLYNISSSTRNTLLNTFNLTVFGLFGVDAVQSVSVTEGDSVSLNVTDVQTNDEIEWSSSSSSCHQQHLFTTFIIIFILLFIIMFIPVFSGEYKGQPIIYILSISAAAVILLLIVVVVCCFCKIHRKTDQKVEAHEEEITYADPTFYKRKAQKSKAQVEEDVVYAGVAVRH
ncbi:uncharacterized protein LOC113071674 [Carassius auratus]|uniref:Uncharacterized protein LOC113071674 n=1 Tax=Carassius auratus TaxID=7957 RepID=A0A6P6MVY6_CARAU|nr:uncharacterized protein LOC113071674 [Carassius auratus]